MANDRTLAARRAFARQYGGSSRRTFKIVNGERVPSSTTNVDSAAERRSHGKRLYLADIRKVKEEHEDS